MSSTAGHTTTAGQPAVIIQQHPGRQQVIVCSQNISNQACGLGFTHVILGVVSIAFNIAAIALGSAPAYAAAGIWSGIVVSNHI